MKPEDAYHPIRKTARLPVGATAVMVFLVAATIVSPVRSAAARQKKPRADTLIAAGVDQLNGPLGTAELFDANAATFSCVGGVNTTTKVCNQSLAQLRFYASVARLTNGEILVAGGNGVGTLCLNSAELFNPATSSFTSYAASSLSA